MFGMKQNFKIKKEKKIFEGDRATEISEVQQHFFLRNQTLNPDRLSRSCSLGACVPGCEFGVWLFDNFERNINENDFGAFENYVKIKIFLKITIFYNNR